MQPLIDHLPWDLREVILKWEMFIGVRFQIDVLVHSNDFDMDTAVLRFANCKVTPEALCFQAFPFL